MEKNNLKMFYILHFLHFLCCTLIASQENEKSLRLRAIDWKYNNKYTEQSFAFCTKQEKEYKIQQEQEQEKFKALFEKPKPIPFEHTSKLIQKTPFLHKACKNNDIETITKYIHRINSINIHRQDQNGDTLVHIACRNNNVEIVKLLCKYFKETTLGIENKRGFTPLHIVCMHNYIKLLKIFSDQDYSNFIFNIKKTNKSGTTTPFNLACIQKHIEMVKLLLWLIYTDIDIINIGDIDNSTPLHHAVENGSIDIITLLLDRNKINPNIKDTVTVQELPSENSFLIVDNNTPLHIACYKNNVKAVKLLLQHLHINPNVENIDKLTPLDIAQANKNSEIATLLLNHPKNTIK